MRGLTLTNPGFVAVAGGGAVGDIYGTLTIGSYSGSSNRYGVQPYYGPGPYGSSNTTPATILSGLYYWDANNITNMIFVGGTYGSIVVDSLDGFIVGCDSLTVTVGSVTAILSLSGPGIGYSIAGDPFNLTTKVGSTVSVNMVIIPN